MGVHRVSLTVQTSVTSIWHQHASAEGDELSERASTPASDGVATASTSSHASSALTHEALAAFEASHAGTGGKPGDPTASGAAAPAGVSRSRLGRSASFGRQDKRSGGGGSGATRVAELSQLVAGAAADARQAESRLAALQFRLRTEVVESAQRSLEHTASLKAPAEQARAYQKQILLMIDQAVRMPTLHSTGGHGPGPLCPDTDLT